MKQKNVILGTTGIVSGKNAFGALPIQRDSEDTAIHLLRKAYEAGFTFFDSARAYSDSEKKIGLALSDVRDKIYIATKTHAKSPEDFRKDLETSLKTLKTDYIDIYQFHLAKQCYRPGDGTGMYECMLEAKKEGKIRHIGITAHLIHVAEEAVLSGLYETVQFPFSYLASERDINLVKLCKEHNVGFICMKALSGGLITNAKAAYAYIDQFENALPIWGIQRESELDEFIEFMENAPEMTDEIKSVIESDRKTLTGDFCRGCGYCMPCPAGITISECARMSQLIRRSPSAKQLEESSQKMMMQIEKCLHCNQCMKKCPYNLPIPSLLEKNLADYKNILSGKVKV